MKREKPWAQHNPFKGLQPSLWLPWSAWCSSAEAQCQACSPLFLSNHGFSTALSDLSLQTRPAHTHTHKVKLCLISSAATNLICTNPEHKWRNYSGFVDHSFDLNECELFITGETMKRKSWKMREKWTVITVKTSKWLEIKQNSQCTLLIPAHRFCPLMPHAFLFSGLMVGVIHDIFYPFVLMPQPDCPPPAVKQDWK